MITQGAEMFETLFPGFRDAQWIRNLPKARWNASGIL